MSSNNQSFYACFIFFSILLNSLPAKAIVPTPGDIPVNVTPGAVNQSEQNRLENQTRFKQRTKDKEDAYKEEKPEDGLLEESKQDESKIFVKEIIVDDSTIISEAMLKKLVSGYEQREVTFQELQELGAEITNLYKEKGFVTSRVYIPPQKIKDGIVHLQATEGIIKPITLEEGRYFKSRAIFPLLRIDQYDKLNIEKVKNDLARLNENPDIGLIATLKTGTETGTTEVRLQSKDRFPVHLTPFVDNLGRDLIGRERVGIGLTHNNLFGFGDRNTSTFSLSRSSLGVGNNYEIPVGKYGTKLGFNYSHSRLYLSKGDLKDRVNAFATVYSPYISQELYRGKHLLATADLAFDFKNLGTNFGEGLGDYGAYYRDNSRNSLYRDRLRVLRPGLNLDEFDKYGRTYLRNELGIGLDILGATGKYRDFPGASSRMGAGDGFFRYTAFGTRITQLPFGMQDVFRVNGQYSNSLLNSAEQIQVGGAFTVRGYQEGQLIGDSGYVISNELRVPFYVFPKSWKFPITRNGLPKALSPNSKEATYDYVFRDNFQLVGFTDFGAAFVNGNPVVNAPKQHNYAFGTGLGLRVRLTRFLTARLDLGFPVIRNLPERHDMMLHFGLQSELF